MLDVVLAFRLLAAWYSMTLSMYVPRVSVFLTYFGNLRFYLGLIEC